MFAVLESVWNLLQNPYDVTHLTLGMLLHYLGKQKIIFCRYPADMEENANKLHFNCTDFNSSMRINCILSVLMCFFNQNLVLVAECHVDCWQTLQWRLLWRISRATDWLQSKQVKEQWHRKLYLQSVWWKTRYLRHLKYQNLWTNNKGRSNKNAIYLHFSMSAEHWQKIWIFHISR